MQKRNKLIGNLFMLVCIVITFQFCVVRASATEVTATPSQATNEDWDDVTLNETSITRAIGTSYTLKLEDVKVDASTYSLSYTSDNSSIASVDATGNVQAIAVGTTNINCTVKLSDDSTKSFTCTVTVTDPKLSDSDIIIGKGGILSVIIDGSTSDPDNVTVSNTSVVSVEDASAPIQLKGLKKGTSTIQIEIDGRTIVSTVTVTQPKLNTTLALVVKGKGYQIKVTGHSKKTPVVYSSSSTSIASVSKTGYIKGLKYGATVVTVSVDNATFKVTVAVGKKATIGAIKNAQKALGKKYSQPRRMSKNYFDCSSLVWRSYKPYKYYFGHKTYAPTAAVQASYLVKKKKVVAYSGVSESKLQPGDVLYISSKKNGRYKNITHTAIYIGNNKIIHATVPKVEYNTYTKYKSKIKVIARPTK